MESDQGCFSACFSNITSTSSKLNSSSNYRQERINDDLSPNRNTNKIHSLSRNKDTKFAQKQIDNKKSDALMMVIHSKIGKRQEDKTPQKKFMKNDINFSSSRNVCSSKQFQGSVFGSNFKSYPDQRSTNCKQYFSGNQSHEKMFKQSSIKMSQGSQNQNSKVDSNGSYVKVKKCQILLLESRIKAKQRQSQRARQKIPIQDQDIAQGNKKMSNHMLRNTKNLRYSMVESSSNSKQIVETPIKIGNTQFQSKKPLSSTGVTQDRRINLQRLQISDSEKQNISQKRLFHNLSPSTGKKSCEKNKKQAYISLNKQSSYNYPLKLNKKTVESYASESKNTSKMSQIISKIVGQDGRKTGQLKHINIIRLPNANNSYSNIPLEDDSFKDLNNCFLKKQPMSLNQKNSFSHNKKKDSPMDILMDESLGFFIDQSPIRSIQLNLNSGLSCLSNQKKQKLQAEVVKNKFLGIGRYFNNHLSLIKQIGFVFNAKEVSTFTVKNQGIQHKIYQCLDISTRLFHPNILRVYYASNYKNKLTIYQQLGQGNLDQELSNSLGRFSQEKTVKILSSLLKGLAYIHSYAGYGFAHKSLKPKNIIFVNGTPKIEWLGYQDSMISGYISPEMRRGSPCGKKSDIWSIGIIAYVMIYGTMPIIETNFEPKKIQQVEQQKEGSLKESINKDSQGNQKVCLLEGDEFESKSFQISLRSSQNEEKVQISQEFEDFLKKTLQEYERNRMSAIECLAHPLLRKYRSEEETSQMSFNQRIKL